MESPQIARLSLEDLMEQNRDVAHANSVSFPVWRSEQLAQLSRIMNERNIRLVGSTWHREGVRLTFETPDDAMMVQMCYDDHSDT